MKKIIYLLGVTMLLTAGTVFTGCNSTSDKTDRAMDDADDAQQKLDEARAEEELQQQRTVTPEEWEVFRMETELKIKENEIKIAGLKAKIMKPGEILDPLRQKRIEELEERNNELKAELRNYNRSNSDWETFKREFNHDMEELGKALKNLTVDNKK
jgi:hypothetical protein